MSTAAPPALIDAIRAVVRLARIAEQECRRTGLSMAQYRFLAYAARRPRRAGELERLAGVTRPAVTAIASGLVDLGLMEREAVAEDGRGVQLVVTPSGRRVMQRAERRMATHFKKILGGRGQLAAFVAGTPSLDDLVDRDMEKEIEREAARNRKVSARPARSPKRKPRPPRARSARR